MKPSLTIGTHVQILIVKVCYIATFRIRKIGGYALKTSNAYPPGAVFLLGLLLVQSAHAQTSIIAIRLRDQSAVGADSKRFRPGGPSTKTCKIQDANGFFFAAAGFVENPDFGFSLSAVIHDAPKIKGTLDQEVRGLENAIREPLARGLDQLRSGNPAEYALRFETASALQVVFLGFEKGATVIVARDFIPSRSLFSPVEITIWRYSCPGDCSDGEQIFKLGKYQAIDRFLFNHSGFWKSDPVAAVRTLIELEIEDAFESVGPPIDILRITNDGAEWVQRKPECEEAKKEPAKKPTPKPTRRRRKRG